MSSSISLRNEITKRRLSMYLSTGLIKLSFGQCVDICLPSCSSYPWCPFRGLYQEHTFPVLHQAYQSPLTPMMVSTSVSLCSFLIALVDCSQNEAALKSESWDFLTIQCPVLVLLKKIYVYNGHACACSQSCLTLCNPMDCSLPGSSVLGVSRQEYWSGLPFILQGIFPTQGSNAHLLHCRKTIRYRLSHQGSNNTCIALTEYQVLPLFNPHANSFIY